MILLRDTSEETYILLTLRLKPSVGVSFSQRSSSGLGSKVTIFHLKSSLHIFLMAVTYALSLSLPDHHFYAVISFLVHGICRIVMLFL